MTFEWYSLRSKISQGSLTYVTSLSCKKSKFSEILGAHFGGGWWAKFRPAACRWNHSSTGTTETMWFHGGYGRPLAMSSSLTRMTIFSAVPLLIFQTYIQARNVGCMLKYDPDKILSRCARLKICNVPCVTRTFVSLPWKELHRRTGEIRIAIKHMCLHWFRKHDAPHIAHSADEVIAQLSCMCTVVRKCPL